MDEYVAFVIQQLSVARSGCGGHKEAMEALNEQKQTPQYFQALAYVFGTPSFPIDQRQSAGLEIKVCIKNALCHTTVEVQQAAYACVVDPEKRIQTAACSIISSAVSRDAWPPGPTVQQVMAMLENHAEPGPIRGALSAIAELVDENVEILDCDTDHSAAMTPKIADSVLGYLGSGDPAILKAALLTTNVLLEQAASQPHGAAFKYFSEKTSDLLALVKFIFEQVDDPSFVVPAIQCTFYQFMYRDTIVPMMDGVVQMILPLATSPSSVVRTEVVQFFKAALEAELAESLPIGDVLVYLLSSLRYEENELAMLDGGDTDAGQPDRPEDIRPRNFQIKAKRVGGLDDDIEDDGGEVDQWNLRTAAGQCLYEYAKHFGDKVMPYLQAPLWDQLHNGQDWLAQEGAIYAIAAMAGAVDDLNTGLGQIFEKLFEILQPNGAHYLVQSMSIYALEECADWIADSGLPYLERTVGAILAYMGSGSKLLQTRAISALGTLCQTVETEHMMPYMTQVVETMAAGFSAYQMKNQYALFETASDVYECFGRELAGEHVFETVMGPLSSMWTTIGNDSPLIHPFFSALSSACSAIGAAIEPQAQDILDRSMVMAQSHITSRMEAAQREEDMPDNSAEFVIAALDLLSGLVEALGSSFANYLNNPQATEAVTNLLLVCCGDVHSPEIRHSALGLLGELCSSCIGYVESNWQNFGALIQNGLQESECFTVASNAAWAMSSVLKNLVDPTQLVEPTQPYVALVHLLGLPYDTDMKVMRENACISISALMYVYPTLVTEVSTPDYFEPLLDCVTGMQSGPTKNEMLSNMMQTLQANPQLLGPHAPAFVRALSTIGKMGKELRSDLQTLCGSLREGLGSSWDEALSTLSPQQREAVRKSLGM